MPMKTRLRTLLLLIITLAIAAAPLRGALALTAHSSADTDSHCAGMMHSMPSTGEGTQLQVDPEDSQAEDCCHQCDGSCAGSGCTDCAHTGIAIMSSMAIQPDLHNTTRTLPLPVSIPHGIFSPPFRPPVSI